MFKSRGQILAQYLDKKGYLTSLVLDIPISAYHCKMLTSTAPKDGSNEWLKDNSNSSPYLNISITKCIITKHYQVLGIN